MPYISNLQQERAKWVGLAELAEIVQSESGCSVEATREQIRNALADSAIWPLRWEPAPPISTYCHPLGNRVLTFGDPRCPPPTASLNNRFNYWADSRSVSHWQAIEIDWAEGRVLDDFERDAYPEVREIYRRADFGPERPPKPRKAEWRILLLDREACERLWPRHHAAPSLAVAPQSPSGIRTTAAADAERACEEWIASLTERPTNKPLAFEVAQNAVGKNLTAKAFERAWAKVAPIQWKKAGRRKR